MISFIIGYEELLPYNKKDYLLYLDDDLTAQGKWYGISIQHCNATLTKDRQIDFMGTTFKQLIDKFSSGQNWIVCHEDKDMPWFLETAKNNTAILLDLKAFFNDHGISDNFIGGISMPEEVILGNLLKDITSYPFAASPQHLYKNLTISHPDIPLIVKVTDHMTIDVISTEAALMDEITQVEFSGDYKIVPYV